MEEQITDPGGQPEKIKTRKGLFKKSSTYLRELSVVVIGVAITFLASAGINAFRERKILDSHLAAVRIELKDNLDYLREQRIYYVTLMELGWYLASMPQGMHHPDSVWSRSLFYKDGDYEKSVLEYSSYLNIEKSAFETLKSSGSMNLLKDQTLMRELQRCYNTMEAAKQEIDKSTDKKKTLFENAVISNRISDGSRMHQLLLNPLLEDVFIYFSRPYMTYQLFDQCTGQIAKTLEMFR